MVSPNPKLYTRVAIIWGTLLGGPVAAGYFLSKNFKVLGDTRRAAWTFRMGLLAIVVFAVLIGTVPDAIQDRVPSSLIPFAYIIFAERYFSLTQARLVKERLRAGATKQPIWKVAGIGILTLLLSFAAMFIIAFLLHHFF